MHYAFPLVTVVREGRLELPRSGSRAAFVQGLMERSLRAARDPSAVGVTVAWEPRSFEDFFAAEHARLFGALCLVTGDGYEAEEVMQDAFLRLWDRWDRVSRFEDPGAHHFRTAMNVFNWSDLEGHSTEAEGH